MKEGWRKKYIKVDSAPLGSALVRSVRVRVSVPFWVSLSSPPSSAFLPPTDTTHTHAHFHVSLPLNVSLSLSLLCLFFLSLLFRCKCDI